MPPPTNILALNQGSMNVQLPASNSPVPNVRASTPSLCKQLLCAIEQFCEALTRGFGIVPAPADPRINLGCYGPKTNFRYASQRVMTQVIHDWPQEAVPRSRQVLREDGDLKKNLLRTGATTGPLPKALADYFGANVGREFSRCVADVGKGLKAAYCVERQQWVRSNPAQSAMAHPMGASLKDQVQGEIRRALGAGGSLRQVLEAPALKPVLTTLFKHFKDVFDDAAVAHRAVYNGLFLCAMGRAISALRPCGETLEMDYLASEILKVIQAECVAVYDTSTEPTALIAEIRSIYASEEIRAEDFLRAEVDLTLID